MEKLDAEGILTRVYLKELSELDAKLPTLLSSQRAENETVSFLQTMKKLVEKQKGVDINPTHRGQVIDMSIMLVAREGILDPTPYFNYAEKCWDSGLPRLYVMAQGDNTDFAKDVVIGINSLGKYCVEKAWSFRIARKKDSFDSYVAVMSRIQK